MNWLIPAIVATLAATLVLTLVYAFLYLHERRMALGLWTLAWIFSCFRYVVELGLYDHRNDAPYILGVQGFSLLTGVFLIWGCFAWIDRRLPVVWLAVAGLCGAWITVGAIAGWTLRGISMPNFLFIGTAYLVTGLIFWRRRELGQVGRLIVAVAFVLWALHKYDYPFLRTIDAFAPWGYLPSSALSLIVAIGLLIAYLERDRLQLHETQSRMQGLLDSTQETLALVDPKGILLACNETTARRMGKSVADLIGHNLYEMLPQSVALSRREKIEMTFRLARPQEFEDHRDGVIYWNHMTPVLDPDGSVRAVAIFGEDITLRRRAEADRNHMFTYSVDLLCIAGFDGFYRELNPAWMQTLGWSETELKSRPWLDFVHPDDQAATVEAGRRLAEGQILYGHDNRYRCKDGSWRWLSWNAFPLLDQGLIFAVARDVTRQKTFERTIHESEATLNGIYRAAPVGIGMVRNRVFDQVNDRVCEISGYSREELIGQSSRTLYPSQEEYDRVGRVKYDQVRRLGIGSVETRWQRKDGVIVDILLSSAPLNPNDLSEGVVFTAMDITERKKAEAALAESEAKFRAIASHTPDHILMQDLDLRYTFVVNPQLGLTEADMIGKTDGDFLSAEDAEKLIAAKRKVLQTGQPLPFAASLKNKHGGEDYFEGSYIPKFGADGRVDGLIGYVRNITDRMKAEEALRESENLLQESQFIAGLGSYVLDIPTGLWKSSAVLDRVFGIGEAFERSVEGWAALIHPDDRQQMSDYFANEVVGKGIRFDKEYRIIRHDTQVVRWVHGLGNLEFDAQGRPRKMFGTIQDITEQKRAEKALAHSHDLMRYIIEHNRSAVAVHDRDLRYIYVSQRYLDDYKVKEKDVIGKHHYEVFPDLPQKWRDVHQRALAGEVCSAEDDPYYREDGTVDWTRWECRPWYQADGSIGGIIIYTEVVTDRKRAEIEREAAIHVFNLINTDSDLHQLMKDVINYFRAQFDFQAVGIRLREGEDFPYFETRGFPDDFLRIENRLCAVDEQGRIVRDSDGNAFIECMCGNILCGRTDPAKPFFSAHGSFWTNSTTILLATTTDADRQTRTRNYCNTAGYESLALVPLRSGKETFGLIQFNDKRRNKFTPELIALFERLADSLATALAERRAQEALRISEEKFSEIFRLSPEMVSITRISDGVLLDVNESFEKILGFSRQEALGHSSLELGIWVDPEERTRMFRILRDKGAVRQFEVRLRCKDKKIVPALFSMTPVEIHGDRFLLCMVVDITSLQKAQQMIRESERRLSTLMSNLPGIAYRCLNDRDWTMEFISEGCMALTGYPAGDLVGNAKLSYNDIIIPEDREMVWETVQKALSERRPYQIIYRIRTAGGIVRWVWEQGRGVFDPEGKLEALEGFVADMNARVLAEQQREQLLKDLQAKTEELESIIYVSSHDLRSPLVNIQGFSGELGESCRKVRKLLSGDAAPESDHQQLEELLGQDIPSALEYITSSVSKLDALQKGLLKICRIGRETLEIGPVVMNELIDSALKSIRYQIDNAAAQVTVESLPNCLADAGQLTQAFTNLIDNAIKYRNPDRPLVIRIYGRVEGACSIYAVADNGVGIAPEHQQKVFEMFHQLDPINGPGGEGLGLTIVKRILGRMDGQVRLESAPGVGSVFSVLLPKA
jgi:PAS domain S-box-containing protein